MRMHSSHRPSQVRPCHRMSNAMLPPVATANSSEALEMTHQQRLRVSILRLSMQSGVVFTEEPPFCWAVTQ